MTIFNPETIFRAMMGVLGIAPEDAARNINFVLNELRTIEAERIAFKAGAGKMVQHFNERLDEQDQRLCAIEGLLCLLCKEMGINLPSASPMPTNGRMTHVGNDSGSG